MTPKEYRVYRSLDRPLSFFGIKGRFTMIAGVGLGVSALLALIMGNTSGNSLVGLLTFLGGAVVSVVFVFTLQARFSERTLVKFIAAKKIPSFIRFGQISVFSIVRGGRGRKDSLL